jgi:uncharacterized protein (TIGR02646 family)
LKTFEFKASIYADVAVKDALRQAQHRWCAFCESVFDHVGYGDVEHYRPKGGYKQRETDELKLPGYYWLAYDWDNLFYSCQLCNQRFKKNLFPLRDGRRRARSHRHSLDHEEALLLDPGISDPSSYISFRAEYAYPIGGCLEGETTIDVLGLNRDELVEVRRDRLATLKVLLLTISLLREKLAVTPTPVLSGQLQELENRLQARRGPGGDYSAMVRDHLAQPSLF